MNKTSGTRSRVDHLELWVISDVEQRSLEFRYKRNYHPTEYAGCKRDEERISGTTGEGKKYKEAERKRE